MSKAKLIVFFCFFSTIICGCKTTLNRSKQSNYINYYNKIYNADSLFLIEKYKESFNVYNNVITNYTPVEIFDEYYNYLKVKTILGKNIKKKEYLFLVENLGYDSIQVHSDSILKKSLKKFEKSYTKYRNKYLSKINLELRNEIKIMIEDDQRFRIDPEVFSKNSNTQDSLDKINADKIINIFKKYGFPSNSIIGRYNVDKQLVDIKAILNHTSDSLRENFLIDKVGKYVHEGTCNPQVLANIIDQLKLYNGEKQIYGSILNGQGFPVGIMIDSIDSINAKRKSIGLFSVGYDIWRFEKIYGVNPFNNKVN